MNLRRGRAAHLKLGRDGERAAARYLELCGCRILGRNCRTFGGDYWGAVTVNALDGTIIDKDKGY